MGKKRQPPSDDEDDGEEEELKLEEFEESEEEEYDSDVRISYDLFFRLRAARIPTGGANAEQPKQPPLLSLSLSVCLSLFFLCVFTPQPVRSLPVSFTRASFVHLV